MGDQDRGYLLELLLTKLRYATAAVDDAVDGSCAGAIQIVGMSATLSNAADLAEWLCARLYQTDFRPVQLFKYIKVGKHLLRTCSLIWHRLIQWVCARCTKQTFVPCSSSDTTRCKPAGCPVSSSADVLSGWRGVVQFRVPDAAAQRKQEHLTRFCSVWLRALSWRVHLQIGRQLRDSAGQDARLLETEPEWEARDPDHVLLLCKETIELGKSVLVFCGTKRVGALPQILQLPQVQCPHAPVAHTALACRAAQSPVLLTSSVSGTNLVGTQRYVAVRGVSAW